jgi:hypothetical protein
MRLSSDICRCPPRALKGSTEARSYPRGDRQGVLDVTAPVQHLLLRGTTFVTDRTVTATLSHINGSISDPNSADTHFRCHFLLQHQSFLEARQTETLSSGTMSSDVYHLPPEIPVLWSSSRQKALIFAPHSPKLGCSITLTL